MTQITGKIYQMKDASGNENRFPRTVIEGVLGLSSYLQNQFSSLADIYMPIGGIYQSQTGQEFVYRATPNTIKAKSFTLDRIQGKSLAWNQIFDKGYITSGSVNGITITNNNDGSITLNGTASASIYFNIADFLLVNNHKIYFDGFENIPNGISLYANGGNMTIYGASSARIKKIATAGAPGGNNLIFLNIPANSILNSVKITPQIVDLTLLYGSEISGMTDEQILAKFESEYPGYHDYSAGKLISNDAKQLETVGRNVWDEEWENGRINIITGADSSANGIRSKNYIPAIAGETYYFKKRAGDTSAYVLFYDGNNGCIDYHDATSILQFSVPSGASFMRFYIPMGDAATTYNHDICINLSDESFNGQYEPHRKVVLPLNLDDFWVKDDQGNQVHITGGLKSAGSVYDEIVGNKYIKRVGSVDLGSLGWTMSAYTHNTFSSNEYLDTPAKQIAGWTPNFVCQAYAQATSAIAEENKTIRFYYNGSTTMQRIAVFDDSHTAADLVNGHASWLEGVYMFYELATPIEYDLVEPLIYTMKAGTTEARISSNEDGLSAPFCCDMTYSASDNNDADNAQYAATAGRLLNTHTILGQQFNGTQDIGGAISDVSSIDGAIIFNLTNPNDPKVGISTLAENITERLTVNGNVKATQLISTATGTLASGTPPLTVASKTMVSNLNANYVGGKTLAEILASDITGNAKTATNAKSESKDDQEFMFRKTNVDWDAKSGAVKKIKGKTIVVDNQLASNDADAVETTGANQWDEEWEVGIWNPDTGEAGPDYQKIRCKNFIPVLPSTQYYYRETSQSPNCNILFYDANKNYLGRTSGFVANINNFTTSANCRYIKFYNDAGYGTTYNHDICINLSNPAINGQYFPYWKRDLQLGLNSFKVKDAQGNVTTVDGLKSAGGVHDEIDLGRGKYIKRVKKVRMEDLPWAIIDLSVGRYAAAIDDRKIAQEVGMIDSKYAIQGYVTNNGNVIDKHLAYLYLSSYTQIYIADSSHTTSLDEFVGSITGEELVYELATPIEYDLVDPLPSVYPCDQYGTERIISPESTTPSAPFIADLQYGAKSDDVAKELIDTRATVQPLLDAFEYDSTNEAWRLKGNFYADGFVSAYGTNESEALEALKAWVTENFEPKQS